MSKYEVWNSGTSIVCVPFLFMFMPNNRVFDVPIEYRYMYIVCIDFILFCSFHSYIRYRFVYFQFIYVLSISILSDIDFVFFSYRYPIEVDSRSISDIDLVIFSHRYRTHGNRLSLDISDMDLFFFVNHHYCVELDSTRYRIYFQLSISYRTWFSSDIRYPSLIDMAVLVICCRLLGVFTHELLFRGRFFVTV